MTKKRYGGFNHYIGDNKAVPLVDAWTYAIGSTSGGYVTGPTAVTAYSNFDYAELHGLEGEVFIDIRFPNFTLLVSPREAKAIAQMLNNIADFIVEGKDEL